MEEVLQLSRQEYNAVNQVGSSSGSTAQETLHCRTQVLEEEIAEIDAEISGLDREIRRLEDLRSLRAGEREELLRELQQLQSVPQTVNGKGKAKKTEINYCLSSFDWSQQLRLRMKKVFGIENFRLCQEGFVIVAIDAALSLKSLD
jgi:ATP-dependent DNA helicase Q1